MPYRASNTLITTPDADRPAGRSASGVVISVLEARYGIPIAGQTLDPLYWLEAAAARHTSNDTARMAQRLLDDFRKSALGNIALELPEPPLS